MAFGAYASLPSCSLGGSTMQSQLWKIAKNLLLTLWMPVVVYLFFVLLRRTGKTALAQGLI
jgi:hypothetical protein